MRGYAQLTLDQRYQIQECKRWKRKLKLSTIAARVGVSVSTISRELKRNCTAGRGYRAKHAHNLALQRREDKPTTRIDVERWRRVEYLLRQDWSPEQITLWQKKHKFPSVSVWIDERPESVEKRWRFGDWEIDTMFGKYSRYPLLTLVERKSRLTLITLVKSKNAEEVAQAIIDVLEPYRHRVRQSHQITEKSLHNMNSLLMHSMRTSILHILLHHGREG